MGSKRRDLKRRGRKNMKKYTENTRSLSEEVFADGLKSPNCAIILVHCLLSIENQVMELFALMNKPNTRKLSNRSHWIFCQTNLMSSKESIRKKKEKIIEFEAETEYS